MSFVTGVSMRKPNESGYNQVRRFLVANNNRAVTKKMVDNAYIKAGGDNASVKENNVSQLALSISRYEELIAPQPANKDVSRKSSVPLNYRPKKHCDECASVVFHSYIFDLPFVKSCPVHKCELSEKCAKCALPWPTLSDLAKRECDVCGIGVSFKVLAEREYLKRVSRYEELSDLEWVRVDLHKSEFPYAHLNLHWKNRRFSTNSINLISSLSLAVLHSLKLLPESVVEYIRNTKFECLSPNSISFDLAPRANPSEVAVLPRLLSENVIAQSSAEIEDALQAGMTHRLGSCTRPRHSCVRCSSWHLWRYVVDSNTDNILQKERFLWADYHDYFYRDQKEIEFPEVREVVLNDKTCSESRAYPLPAYVRQEIRHLDYRTAFLNIFAYVTNFRAFTRKSGKYLRMELDAAIPKYALPYQALPTPYVFRSENNVGKLYWPDLDLGNCIADMDFFYKPFFRLHQK